MAQVTFIQQDGKKIVIENAVGSLMEIATENDVDGITGDCGGVCSCSTCHVYVALEWQSKLASAEELEIDTLDFNDHKQQNSRLCCQIEMSDALDDIVVEVAPEE